MMKYRYILSSDGIVFWQAVNQEHSQITWLYQLHQLGARKLPKPPQHAKVSTSINCTRYSYLLQLDSEKEREKEKEVAN